jgi:hypothetical protein
MTLREILYEAVGWLELKGSYPAADSHRASSGSGTAEYCRLNFVTDEEWVLVSLGVLALYECNLPVIRLAVLNVFLLPQGYFSLSRSLNKLSVCLVQTEEWDSWADESESILKCRQLKHRHAWMRAKMYIAWINLPTSVTSFDKNWEYTPDNTQGGTREGPSDVPRCLSGKMVCRQSDKYTLYESDIDKTWIVV